MVQNYNMQTGFSDKQNNYVKWFKIIRCIYMILPTSTIYTQ